MQNVVIRHVEVNPTIKSDTFRYDVQMYSFCQSSAFYDEKSCCLLFTIPLLQVKHKEKEVILQKYSHCTDQFKFDHHVLVNTFRI